MSVAFWFLSRSASTLITLKAQSGSAADLFLMSTRWNSSRGNFVVVAYKTACKVLNSQARTTTRQAFQNNLSTRRSGQLYCVSYWSVVQDPAKGTTPCAARPTRRLLARAPTISATVGYVRTSPSWSPSSDYWPALLWSPLQLVSS